MRDSGNWEKKLRDLRLKTTCEASSTATDFTKANSGVSRHRNFYMEKGHEKVSLERGKKRNGKWEKGWNERRGHRCLAASAGTKRTYI